LSDAAKRKPKPSDRTRAARLRLQRAAGPAHLAALEFAGRLELLRPLAPDEESRRELNRLIARVRLRGCGSDERKREAVATALARWGELSAVEIANETGLCRDEVCRALNHMELAGAAVSFTRGGRRNAGRNGPVVYWRPRGAETLGEIKIPDVL
jgi:hypothetical protein